jgi:hypothetical protein
MRRRGIFRVSWGLTVLLALGGGSAFAQAPHGTPVPGRWQPPPPPKNWTTPEVKGYTDGVKAAWLDLAAGATRHPERQVLYQKPPSGVKLDQRYFYRLGFRDGYDLVYAHEHREPQSAGSGTD